MSNKIPSSIMNGSFGIGANPFDAHYGSGGGGGYYGGGAGNIVNNCVGTGSGGSSFISGYKGCDAISQNYTLDNPVHTGKPYHYSGFVFVNPIMKDGNTVQYSGNGQARITVAYQEYFNIKQSCVNSYSMSPHYFYLIVSIIIDC